LLFTTEGTRRIIDTLNTAFDGPSPDPNKPIGLDVIRSLATPGSPNYNRAFYNKIYSRKWKAGHLARMLLLLPFDQGTPPGTLNNSDTKRWHWFLVKVFGPSAAFQPICVALADAILNYDSNNKFLNIVRVTFDHVDQALPYPVVMYDSSLPLNAGNVRHITLYTTPNVPAAEQGSRFDPKDSDEPDAFENAPWRTDPGPWDKP
jgi:hypothetical protein